MLNNMSWLDILVVTIGTFYFSIWCTRILALIQRSYFGTECTTERYGEKTWAIVAGI